MNKLESLKDKLAQLMADKERAIALNKIFTLGGLNKDINQLKSQISSIERQIKS